MTDLVHAIACAVMMAAAPPQAPGAPPPLRTFVIEKSSADPLAPDDAGRSLAAPQGLPASRDHLRTNAGLAPISRAASVREYRPTPRRVVLDWLVMRTS